MKLIVGLGNPGREYEETRHNVGFGVVDVLAQRWNINLSTEKFHGWFGRGDVCQTSVVLLKPTTFMNLSGRAVLGAGRFYKLELSDLLVISDDLALPLGRIRIRSGGSGGGHNGLTDIIERLGSEEWSRLRLGIGNPYGASPAYVLGRFAKEEEVAAHDMQQRAADAVECWIRDGVDLAMTRFNGDIPPE